MADQRDYSSSWYAPPSVQTRPVHLPRHGAPDPWLRPGPTPPPGPRRSHAGRRLDANGWHWLLWIPIVVPLWPGLYNRVHPQLGGLPFYYWGQLAFALLAAITIAVVHIATKGR
jgi:hypothetical protein